MTIPGTPYRSRPGKRAAQAGRQPKERPPEPPPDAREGGTVPANPQEMAHRPAPPARHPRPAPGPPGHLHRLLQPPAAAQVTARPGHPATAYAARPKAAPGDRGTDTHNRVRTDIIGETGTVTLRHAGKLYHIGIGRTHARTHILLLVQDLHVRIVDAATGELLRDLTLDPARNYQPTGKPQRPPPRTPRQRKTPGP